MAELTAVDLGLSTGKVLPLEPALLLLFRFFLLLLLVAAKLFEVEAVLVLQPLPTSTAWSASVLECPLPTVRSVEAATMAATAAELPNLELLLEMPFFLRADLSGRK